MSQQANYWVGIDLGTTHTVVAYRRIDPQYETPSSPNTQDDGTVKLLTIPQWVGLGEIESLPWLPSFRYHPLPDEFASDQLNLPWPAYKVPGDDQPAIIGAWARELSSQIEGRTVVSAKSWLSHPQADRTASILPWASDESVHKISPVQASASYLAYIRSVWDHQFPDDLLEHQQIVITIPASFDEVARTLTLEAARLAGLQDGEGEVLLLEEPQAVCYDWIRRQPAEALQQQQFELLLVCDVGGGTTDLSLIHVDRSEGKVQFTRVGVGDHLMLGGDNIDFALAHTVEQQLMQTAGLKKRLTATTLSKLLQQTRRAKEVLLENDPPEHYPVTVLSRGSGVIGQAKRAELLAADVHQQVFAGFFATCDVNDSPAKRKQGIVEFGLPYAADPCITKHIAHFLQHHQQVCRESISRSSDAANADNPVNESGDPFVGPDAVIFNGGVFKSQSIGDQLSQQLSAWGDHPVLQLENPDPDLAVAYGAVAYSMARAGSIAKIGGGSARTFLLAVDTDQSSNLAICLLPRGTEASKVLTLHQQRFALRLGTPVAFQLYSTASDERWEPGAQVDLDQLDRDALVMLPPLVSALEVEGTSSAQEKAQAIEVVLSVVFTEVGTIELECIGVEEQEDLRWRLEFQLRSSDLLQQGRAEDGADVDRSSELPKQFLLAKQSILDVFGKGNKKADPKAIKLLRSNLEKWLDKRESWSFQLSRSLADLLLTGMKHRRRTAQHERIWFNLTGFACRPGFGDPLDAWRLEQLWPLYQVGLQFNQTAQIWAEWWTFWRRLSGGLSADQQAALFKDIAKYINPATARNRKVAAELKGRSYEDIVRLVGSLEHLSADKKSEIGEWLLKRLEKASESDVSWWALGRVGARVPFYGSAHNVVNSDIVSQWLKKVLEADWNRSAMIPLAATLLARKSGDRTRDIDDALSSEVITRLKEIKSPAHWIEMVAEGGEVEAGEQKKIYGDALPSGLLLIQSEESS